jgi:hypothetical protein
VIDEDTKDIVVLQSKHRDKDTSTQGDADLKSFVGVAPYFAGPDGIDSLLASGPRPELLKLVERLKLRDKLESGNYSVTLAFVTNATADVSATDYVQTLSETDLAIELYDRGKLAPIARRTLSPGLVDEQVEFSTPAGVIVRDFAGGGKIAIALVPASEPIALPKLDTLEIFDLNVRLGLGKTKINRELRDTVKKADEHDHFPAYHNGLTLLTSTFEITDGKMKLDGISVVNGCQSLLALYANSDSVTPKLELPVKVVEVTDAKLAETITYRTNNQNSVNMRDQRSNDPAQRALQGQLHERYGKELFYAIRNGEDTTGFQRVLDNRLAAQLLMAVYLGEPWAAVRKIKLFDDEYFRVFSKRVNADRLYLLDMIDQAVADARAKLRPDLTAAFASVRFTLAYLVGEVLRLNELGTELLEYPERWLPAKRSDVAAVLASLAEHAATTLSDFVTAREEDPLFDFKTTFKSRTGVLEVQAEARHVAELLERRVGGFLFAIPVS